MKAASIVDGLERCGTGVLRFLTNFDQVSLAIANVKELAAALILDRVHGRPARTKIFVRSFETVAKII